LVLKSSSACRICSTFSIPIGLSAAPKSFIAASCCAALICRKFIPPRGTHASRKVGPSGSLLFVVEVVAHALTLRIVKQRKKGIGCAHNARRGCNLLRKLAPQESRQDWPVIGELGRRPSRS
jgi:hypothetical protein